MTRVVLALGLSLAVTTAASAQPVRGVVAATSDESISAPKGVKTGDPDRRVCKVLTATGSRLARAKACKSAREWAEQQQQIQDDLHRYQKPRKPDERG